MKNCEEHPHDRSGNHLLYQYVAVFTGVIMAVCVGMHMGWPSPSLPLLLNETSTIPTTTSDGSWIVAIPYIAQPFGSLTTALVINRIGRKICILLSSPVLFISWVSIAYADSVFTIECARVLAGFGFGIVYTGLPMYVSEVADKRIRGLLGCSIQAAAKLGILLINIIGLKLDIRITALFAASIPALHFVTFCWMPESPYFFLLRNRNRRAADSLKKLTRSQNVDTEISEISSMITTLSEPKGKILDLFTKPENRRALGVILGLRTLEHFSGFYAIMSYCLMIFNETGGTIDASTATIIYCGIQLIVSILSCVLVDKAGRRALLIISVIGTGCGLLIEGGYLYLKYRTNTDLSNWGFVSLAALLIYTSSYCIGLATIPILMIGELFPTSIKSYAVGIGIAWFAANAAIVSKLFQIIKDEYGSDVPFFIFAIFCVIGLFFIIRFVPETKGKSLEQIQLESLNLSSKLNKSKMKLAVLDTALD